MKKNTIPPNLCPEVEEDKKLLDEIAEKEGAITITYAGTIESGTDYRDLYLVLTRDRVLHIIAVRRLCPNTKILEQHLKDTGAV